MLFCIVQHLRQNNKYLFITYKTQQRKLSCKTMHAKYKNKKKTADCQRSTVESKSDSECCLLHLSSSLWNERERDREKERDTVCVWCMIHFTRDLILGIRISNHPRCQVQSRIPEWPWNGPIGSFFKGIAVRYPDTVICCIDIQLHYVSVTWAHCYPDFRALNWFAY